MELIQVGKKTYYIKNPTNIGIYKINNNDVYLIDSGNDKDAGRKILKIMNEQGWTVKGIINTHSNADHIGGNKIISDRTGCDIYAYGIEQSFTQHTLLEPSFLYGGYPFKGLRNKFLMAKDTDTKPVENNLPEGLEYIVLKGHFFDMIGVKTSDNVLFLADSLFSEETIGKYHLFFIYDVRGFLETLDKLEEMDAAVFIPSHCEATENINALIRLNRDKINEIAETIFNICEKPVSFETILKQIFDRYSLVMNTNQYVLIGSTIRSYLSYLCDDGRLEYCFDDNKMLWQQIKNS
ncbi:MAG: MBL fold metallo-hydrolase [Eubacterium sp.]|nr:MBL fold metallo-hydrolase [Eubacterium sp.]